MKSFNNVALRSKLIGLCLGLLVFGGLANTVGFLSVIKKVEDSSYREFEQHAQNVSESIASQFYERYRDVQTFAGNEVFKKGSKQEIANVLNDYVAAYSAFDAIVFVDTEGNLLSVNNKSADGKLLITSKLFEMNFSKADWFRETLSGELTQDSSKGITGAHFEDFQLDPISSIAFGEKRWGTVFSSPVKDANGKPIGVLSARANFRWVENEFENLYRSLKVDGFSFLEFTMVNQTGAVILDFDPDETKSATIDHDETTLLKQNLLSEKYEPVVRMKESNKEGALIANDPRHGHKQLVGFTPVKSSRFLDNIGWKVMVRIPFEQAFAAVISAKKQYFSTMLGVISISLVLAFLMSGKISQSFRKIGDSLGKSVSKSGEFGVQMSEAANQLASASQQQAAAIQESVSALSEMSSMLAMTGENVRHSLQSIDQSREKTEEGKQIMQQLGSAMEAIQRTNVHLQEVTKVIEDINSKTTVINDIVFKTQLLSFNASIEAARAGQHGRGFSVVAEEVGNLAEMSGTAARDIEILIGDSQRKVREILEQINGRVEVGQKVSTQAGSVFNDIATSIQEIATKMRSINEATQQQQLGIDQTNSAMRQLDIAAKSNNITSMKSLEVSQAMELESRTLQISMNEMLNLVDGKSHSKVHESEGPESRNHLFASKKPLMQNRGAKGEVASDGKAIESSASLEAVAEALAQKKVQNKNVNTDTLLDDSQFKKVI